MRHYVHLRSRRVVRSAWKVHRIGSAAELSVESTSSVKDVLGGMIMALIDRDLFEHELEDEFHGMISDESLHIYEILGRLENAPTVDAPKEVHGRWIDTGMSNSTGPILRCSVCLMTNNPSATAVELKRQRLEPKFCPNCGAPMDLREAQIIR